MFFDRNMFKKALFVLCPLALLAFVFRIYTFWTEVENTMGFFRTTPYACYLFNGIGFLVFALCLLLSFRKTLSAQKSKAPLENSPFLGEESLLSDEAESPKTERQSTADSLSPFAARTASWQGTLSAFSTFFPGFSFLAYSVSCLLDPALKQNSYAWMFALLSALSGVYFLVIGFQNSRQKNSTRAFFALVPAFWCTVRMVVEYRDLARFVNKALYIGQFLFIISALLFFLYQAQLLLGEKAMTRPNSYAFSGLAVVFFGITARLSYLVAVVGDRVSADLVDISSLLIDLAITLYVIVKISSVLEEDSDIF